MRLLIVEDEKRLAVSLAKGLTAEGYAVDVVHDGVEGLHRASEGSYDLVILDIMLPGMNGYRVCAALRAMRPRRTGLRKISEGKTPSAARRARKRLLPNVVCRIMQRDQRNHLAPAA